MANPIVSVPVLTLFLGLSAVGPADAESFWLKDGERIDGVIVGVVGGAVTVKRSIGGLEVFKLDDLETTDVRTTEGTVRGRLAGYRDGRIQIVDDGGVTLTITRDGRVIDRSEPLEAEASPSGRDGSEAPGGIASAGQIGPFSSKLFRPSSDQITVVLSTGSTIAGRVTSVTRNTLMLRLAGGGLRPLMRRSIDKASFVTAEGAAIEGQFLDWSDGAYALRLPDDTLAVALMPESAFDEAEVEAFLSPLAVGGTGGPADRAAAEPPSPNAIPAPAAPAKNPDPQPSQEPRTAESGEEDTDLLAIEVIASAQTITEGAGDLDIELLLDRQDGQPVSIFYTTVNGAAAADVDYENTQGYILLGSGTEYGRITVPIIDDDVREDNEDFLVFLSTDPTRAALSHKEVRIGVEDDD